MAGADPRVPRLVVISPEDQRGLILALSASELVIGHSETADLALEDRFVSRRHALITVDLAGQVTIRDLNSTSGTFVNDARLTGPWVLSEGDLVRFADLVARFEPGGAITPALAATQVLAVLTGTDAPPEASSADPGTTYTVTGTVASPALPGVGGLTVRLVDKNVGGDQVLATVQTSSNGGYAVSHLISAAYLARRHKAQPDLQVQVLAGGSVLAASQVSYSAAPKLVLDVALPASAPGLPSEYETLTANLAAVYPGRLGALQENASQQDITYLANKTGWDARAVALAAVADQFSQLTAPAAGTRADPGQTQAWPVPTVSLEPEYYYALFRAGLPSDADGLFQASAAQVQSVWQNAAASGVIPAASAKAVATAVSKFQVLSAAHSLTAAPPVGLSTLQEMLAPTLPQATQQETFARLYAQHQDDLPALWTAVEQEFGTATADQLQLTGQLYYLTVNNEPLVSRLLGAEAASPLTSTLDLVGRGYYEPSAWSPLIGTSIPSGMPGSDAAEQAANYAQLLAAQIRVSYPTAVLADQVSRGVMPIADTAEVTSGVAAFLSTHQADFAVCVEPVEGYLARTGAPAPLPDVLAQVKRLQRVYQITPDDTSMAVLLRHGLDSAFAVTRYDQAGFSRTFAAQLGGTDKADAIHSQARQVFSTTLGAALSYLGARTGVTAGGSRFPVQPGMPAQASPPSYPVTAYATLENLFGSLDYCNCSDCNSILSAAAYLVDLLSYLDQAAPTAGYLNPQDVLLSRRPDLQYLPLTCANTNTALPYIDLVNETLEYYVSSNLSIANYQGHDTSETITSAELVACPQYVDDGAYTILQSSYFPPPLPFNRPLALLRLQLQNLDIALPAAMTALRAGDQLENTQTAVSYGWQDILLEQLTISREEYLLFSDPELRVGLGDLYGLPDATATAMLQQSSLQDLSRRLNVSYDDLSSVVQTQFINPNAVLIPLLQQLDAPFATLKTLHDYLGTGASIAAQFISALPAGLDATPYGTTIPGDYQAVVDWVTGPQVYPRIMDLITITNPTGNIEDCSGSSLYLAYSDPGTTANQLSATDYLKLIRFIRLWEKLAPLLGDATDAVTIEQTDNIISSLYPAANLPAATATDAANRASLDSGFQTLVRRTGFLFQILNLLSQSADGALAQLLACWAPIQTYGANALYQRMFLTPTLLQQDPGAQSATVSATVNAGDVLTTTINGGTEVPAYTVVPGDTAASVAAAIAASINATTAPDPATGLALNSRFYATSQDGVVTIRAAFTLTCQASPAATETYVTGSGNPTAQTATVTVTGNATAGDTLTTTIDGIAIPYTVLTADTATTIAAGIAAAVNSTTAVDPYSGLQLNRLVAASSSAGTLTFSAANAGAPFSLACAIAPANAGTYTAGAITPAARTATISGTVNPDDVLVTTINSIPVSYTAGPLDSTPAALAASIAAAISSAVVIDPQTQLAIGGEVQATASGAVVSICSVDPSSPFTLSCSVTTGSELYTAAGPFPQQAVVTVAGSIPAGATLTTTINGLPLPYQAISGDTPTTVAAAIATLINTDTAVNASAANGVITLTAQGATTAFTVTAAISASGYTAGRQNPPFAADGSGAYLTDPAQTLLGHEPTLCAAFNLTGAEFALITAYLGFESSTQLTLEAVSELFRYGWFAHTLSLSVQEFLQLIQYTGLNPFAPLDPATTGPVPPPAVQFIELLNSLSSAGLTTAQALYLMWNQDSTGTYAPPLSDVTGLAAALVADFAAVEAEFTVQVDPDGSIAKSLMTLVYGTAATDFYFGLLNSTFTSSTGYSVPPGQDSIPAAVVAASSGQLSYDNLAKQLTFTGVLDAAMVTAIDTAATDPAMPAAIASLAAANQQAAGPFFTTYPELLPLYTAFIGSSDPVQAKRQTLLDSFLPVLKLARKQEQALASITASAGTDPSFAAALLQDPAILHSDADPAAAAIGDLTAIQTQGLSAQFFLGNDLTAAPDLMLDAVPSPASSARTVSYVQTAAIGGGTPSAGDTLTTTVNGVPVTYTVTAADTSEQVLAASVAAAINASAAPVTVQDPVTTLPLNQLVSATATGTVITIAGRDPSSARGYVTLATSVSAGAAQTYAAGSQLPAGNGGGDIAAIWSGYVTVAQDGFYDINIAVDPGATITLEIGGAVVPGAQSGGLWSNQGPISLPSGELVPLTLTAVSIKTTLSISWLSQGLGWQPIPVSSLYPLSLVSRLGSTYTRFLKAASLASSLSLVAAEIAYLGTATGFSVNTTGATSVVAGTAAVFTPASMANIAAGSKLIIDDGAAQETVTVTAVTATTFTAAASRSHDGTATPFPVVSQAFPALGEGWLNFLVAQGGQDPATSAALCGVLTGLLDFARIKQALSPADQRLLAVIADPAATLPNRQTALLGLTGWNQASVNALLTQFFGTADAANLGPVENFRRVYDAYAYVTSSGLSAAVLLSAITNTPTPTTVSALQSALRAQYAESDWLTVVGPINDTARIQQRDALVAYIVQQAGDRYAQSIVNQSMAAGAATGATTLILASTAQIGSGMLVQGPGIAAGTSVTAAPSGNTVTISPGTLSSLALGSPVAFIPADAIAVTDADSLYDYFLFDTQNQPPVLTSRILLALSTTQLFIERIIRNLEPQASPADVDTSQWEWMKRYRVWQANREVFLWPENWLYPELRNNQSPFFQQMMSSLLQGDVTDEAATSAYLSYLTSLEEVAKLEPCGLYYQPATAGGDETAYVIARTAGARRKHYFRELAYGAWTPWTEVPIECEDVPITPVVWNNRLFLFWLKAVKTVMPQPAPVPSGPLTSTPLAQLNASDLLTYTSNSSVDAQNTVGKNTVQVSAVLCWSEYYNGNWQPTKTSELGRATTIGTYDASGPGSFEACRTLLRIIPVQATATSNVLQAFLGPSFTIPDGALILGIANGSDISVTGGFLLHNSHSLPVRFEDIPLPSSLFSSSPTPFSAVLVDYNPIRLFPASQPYTGGYGGGTFSLSYLSSIFKPPTWDNKILTYQWAPRWTDVQPGLADAWDAPFFYEDRRNVFYVTTTETLVPLLRVARFGVLARTPGASTQGDIPRLVLRDLPSTPADAGTVAASAAAGGAFTVQRFLSTNPTINVALASAAEVTYDGRLVSPVGSTPAQDPAVLQNPATGEAAKGA